MTNTTFNRVNSLAVQVLDRFGIEMRSQEEIDLLWSVLIELMDMQHLNFDNHLNEQEIESLFWAAKGKTILQTADIMNTAVNSVETYRRSIKRKLKCSSIAQSIFEGIRYGIICNEPMVNKKR